jgi:hypothetical protein
MRETADSRRHGRTSVLRRHLLLPLAMAFAFATVGAGTAHATFTINYSDAANFGFNDNTVDGSTTLGAERRAAFQFAADIWNNLLPVGYTVPIVIDASWAALGSGILGGTDSWNRAYANRSGLPQANTWYPDAIADYLHGADLGGGAWDMQMQFSTNYSWYLGTTGTPGAGKYDFVSVALHEIGHGMGMSGMFDSAGVWYDTRYPGVPMIYDTFLEDTAGNKLIGKAISPTNVTSAVYWDGPNARAANGGNRVALYAPSTYKPGSSIYHLDYPAYQSYLMSPYLSSNTVHHEIDPLTIGILEDIGWDFQDPVRTPEPAAVVLLVATGPLAIVVRRRRPKA